MATRKEVADRAGVSVAAVSYVLNNKNNVREETKQRVLEAVRELGYRPNLMARSLKTKKSQQLAVLVNQLGNPFEAELLLQLEEAARKAGYFVFFQTYRQELEEELKTLFMGRVDGVILMGQSLMDTTVSHFRNLNIPMLSVTKPVWERKELPYIDVQWAAEMRKAIKHLQSHSNIGFMSNGNLAHHHTQRFQGFLQALQFENKLFRQENILYGGSSFDSAYQVMRDRISAGLSFSALLCANDLMAVGVLAACKNAGVRVPEELAVAGCENILMTAQTFPSLTTIHFPREQIAEHAVAMLLQLMSGSKVTPRYVEGELIVRNST